MPTNMKVENARSTKQRLKRERGEVACSECKRLKLRCDKKVPCSSCLRRGCQTICPNGSFTSRHGARLSLANDVILQNKLLDMSKRIRQLEDALNIAHSSKSSNLIPHPLLRDELLSVKADLDFAPDNENEIEDEEEEELAVSLGTLSISHAGQSFFVEKVGTETFLLDRCSRMTNANVPNTNVSRLLSNIPDASEYIARINPSFSPSISKNIVWSLIQGHLPSYERAKSLIESYLTNLALSCRPVHRSQIIEELLPDLYQREWKDALDENEESVDEPHGMHRLALSMALFACGAVVDPTLTSCNREAILFNHLARVALSLKSIFEETRYETVQTIVLLSKFELFVSKNSSKKSAWNLMALGLNLAANIGLHRDPAIWNLDSKSIRRRRLLFWEIYPIDKFRSLISGRPCIFHSDQLDCEPPNEAEIKLEEGGADVRFRAWKYRFIREILAPMSEYIGKVQPVKYTSILELDKRIREFPDYDFPEDQGEGFEFNPRLLVWRSWKEMMLLFLHRNFFAKAMLDQPDNPQRSSFAPSFLAAFTTSISYLKSARKVYNRYPKLVDRQWTFWAHALVATAMLGSIACRTSPSLEPIAARAREELLISVELFEKAADHLVISAGLPILLQLRSRVLSIKSQQDVVQSGPSLSMITVEESEARNTNSHHIKDDHISTLAQRDLVPKPNNFPANRNMDPISHNELLDITRVPIESHTQDLVDSWDNQPLIGPQIILGGSDGHDAEDAYHSLDTASTEDCHHVPHTSQSITDDSWTELGLRTVLDILVNDSSDAQTYPTQQPNTNISSSELGQASFQELSSFMNTSDLGFDATLTGDLPSTFFSVPGDFTFNAGHHGVLCDENPVLELDTTTNGGQQNLQDGVTSPTAASLLEAWRSMIDQGFPDFPDIVNERKT